MPNFTLQIDAAGPIVKATVDVSKGRRDALVAAGLEIPAGRIIRALVDTGASISSIEPEVLNILGLTPTGTIELVTPSTGAGTHTTNTYDVDFTIAGTTPNDSTLVLENLRITSSQLFLQQGIHALIGRDILSRCILIYNGSIAHFTLSY